MVNNSYPLVICYIAIKNGHRNSWFTYENLWFSIVILIYQRVIHHTGWWLTYPSEKYELVSWDDDIPNIWKVIKVMFQSTNQSYDYPMKVIPARHLYHLLGIEVSAAKAFLRWWIPHE